MTISIEAMATLKPPQLHCFSCFYFILLYFFGNQRENSLRQTNLYPVCK